ncbi:MAG TPA: 3' terminal RNA ribose 2'-O-methyltransferase Hen1 [Streptosporangiaceae bacterium]|nr:3' terminal RNA ribose 2'-O-methyltransferase Hen1 [Streptosporangiaceae bacterium]
MLLTITNTTPPAADFGFLLHKNPAALRSIEVGFGFAHVFYPEASDERCTVALLCEVDPVALVRRSRGGAFPLAAYVNDRPYAASSFLSVALRRAFGTAMRAAGGERPALAQQDLALSARVPVLPCRGGEDLLRRLFEPLGYTVTAQPVPLDPAFPAWGPSPYFDVTLTNQCRLADLLGHLYVLLPVLDGAKHYWVTRDEIDKLVDRAAPWLAGHPERETIIRRSLRHQPRLVQEAISRLLDGDAAATEAETGALDGTAATEHARLRDLRVAAVASALKEAGARRVLDLGCGDGRLIAALLADPQYREVVGVDASAAALEQAGRRLGLDEMAPRQRERVRLLLGGLTYADRRLRGYDAAVLMEVVEHIDPGRLESLAQAVFGAAAPATVVVTTPNAEFNVRYSGLTPGALRHPDHRFEWGRAEFQAWAQQVAAGYGYAVHFQPVGAEDPDTGPPTQLAVLTRDGTP